MSSVERRWLTLADIAEPRAYERERPALREHMMGVKARRRVHLGTVVSVVFENLETMRYQVQEMARAEKMTTDEQVQHELDTYNPLIPQLGELSATMFIECTTEDQMKFWFPRLVGIEAALEFVVEGSDSDVQSGDVQRVPCTVDPAHLAQLTREDVTSAVHYVKWSFPPAAIAAVEQALLGHGEVELRCTHPNYLEASTLTVDAIQELLTDLRR
jgi:hypothetical protein